MRHNCKYMRTLPLTVFLAVITTASGASAATFSFASDTDTDSPTFIYNDGFLKNYKQDVWVDLLIDLDDDGPDEPIVVENSLFSAMIELQYDSTQELPGGQYLQIFTASGTFSLWEECGCEMVFYANFFDAVFTSLSTDENSLGATATLQGSDMGIGAVDYAPGPVLMNYGIRSLIEPEDFAFTLTDLNGGAGALISGGEIADFDAEGSYSGSAAVPAPGGFFTLLTTGSLALTRRRRLHSA